MLYKDTYSVNLYITMPIVNCKMTNNWQIILLSGRTHYDLTY